MMFQTSLIKYNIFLNSTLCSSKIRAITLRQMSTPSNSRGRWSGKSTKENLVWSGRAKQREGWILGERISTSTLVFDGTGTGALNKRKIHVSISLMSCRTMDDAPSKLRPVNTVHKDSLQNNYCCVRKKQFEIWENNCTIVTKKIKRMDTWYSALMPRIYEAWRFHYKRR